MTNLIEKRHPLDSEAHIQNLVINNKDVQQHIISNMNLTSLTNIEFSKCKPYINRIIPDIKIVQGNKLIALMECKGSKINVTDYVRGIGQLFQYEYFAEQNAKEKNNNNLEYSKDFQTLYLIPSVVTINNDFNISKFKYPNTSKVLQINPRNYVVRNFSKEQRARFENLGNNLIAVSEYYFRDIRIFELYILLHHLNKFHQNNSIKLRRSDIEKNELRQYQIINNNNWRNAFITLSGLGLITDKNTLSVAGMKFVEYNFFDFLYNVYYSYIEPYAQEILPYLIDNPNIKLSELNDQIRQKHGGSNVLFITESENRYLSSWLGIFRDDYGILDFEPQKVQRKVNYNPLKYNHSKQKDKNSFIEMTKKYHRFHPALLKIIND